MFKVVYEVNKFNPLEMAAILNNSSFPEFSLSRFSGQAMNSFDKLNIGLDFVKKLKCKTN